LFTFLLQFEKEKKVNTDIRFHSKVDTVEGERERRERGGGEREG
jgi:hypothetical protein